jgi:hypothetical protein
MQQTIALLPDNLREELNRRLANGEPASAILAWLNPRPEVSSLLTRHDGEQPIDHDALNDWCRQGFQLWLQRSPLNLQRRSAPIRRHALCGSLPVRPARRCHSHAR